MLGTYALSAGLLRRVLRPGAQGPHADDRRLSLAPTAQADFLLGATAPSVAFKFGEKTSNPLAMYLSDVFTIPTNLAGDPAISVPFGTR